MPRCIKWLGQDIATRRVNWISDADIKASLDNVNHEQLMVLLAYGSGSSNAVVIKRFLKAVS